MNKPFQPRYKFNSDEEWCEYNGVENSDIRPKELDRKVVGWEISEVIVMGLINCAKCEKCNKLVWYNGCPLEICPSCVRLMKDNNEPASSDSNTRQ